MKIRNVKYSDRVKELFEENKLRALKKLALACSVVALSTTAVGCGNVQVEVVKSEEEVVNDLTNDDSQVDSLLEDLEETKKEEKNKKGENSSNKISSDEASSNKVLPYTNQTNIPGMTNTNKGKNPGMTIPTMPGVTVIDNNHNNQNNNNTNNTAGTELGKDVEKHTHDFNKYVGTKKGDGKNHVEVWKCSKDDTAIEKTVSCEKNAGVRKGDYIEYNCKKCYASMGSEYKPNKTQDDNNSKTNNNNNNNNTNTNNNTTTTNHNNSNTNTNNNNSANNNNSSTNNNSNVNNNNNNGGNQPNHPVHKHNFNKFVSRAMGDGKTHQETWQCPADGATTIKNANCEMNPTGVPSGNFVNYLCKLCNALMKQTHEHKYTVRVGFAGVTGSNGKHGVTFKCPDDNTTEVRQEACEENPIGVPSGNFIKYLCKVCNAVLRQEHEHKYTVRVGFAGVVGSGGTHGVTFKCPDDNTTEVRQEACEENPIGVPSGNFIKYLCKVCNAVLRQEHEHKYTVRVGLTGTGSGGTHGVMFRCSDDDETEVRQETCTRNNGTPNGETEMVYSCTECGAVLERVYVPPKEHVHDSLGTYTDDSCNVWKVCSEHPSVKMENTGKRHSDTTNTRTEKVDNDSDVCYREIEACSVCGAKVEVKGTAGHSLGGASLNELSGKWYSYCENNDCSYREEVADPTESYSQDDEEVQSLEEDIVPMNVEEDIVTMSLDVEEINLEENIASTNINEESTQISVEEDIVPTDSGVEEVNLEENIDSTNINEEVTQISVEENIVPADSDVEEVNLEENIASTNINEEVTQISVEENIVPTDSDVEEVNLEEITPTSSDIEEDVARLVLTIG